MSTLDARAFELLQGAGPAVADVTGSLLWDCRADRRYSVHDIVGDMHTGSPVMICGGRAQGTTTALHVLREVATERLGGKAMIRHCAVTRASQTVRELLDRICEEAGIRMQKPSRTLLDVVWAAARVLPTAGDGVRGLLVDVEAEIPAEVARWLENSLAEVGVAHAETGSLPIQLVIACSIAPTWVVERRAAPDSCTVVIPQAFTKEELGAWLQRRAARYRQLSVAEAFAELSAELWSWTRGDKRTSVRICEAIFVAADQSGRRLAVTDMRSSIEAFMRSLLTQSRALGTLAGVSVVGMAENRQLGYDIVEALGAHSEHFGENADSYHALLQAGIMCLRRAIGDDGARWYVDERFPILRTAVLAHMAPILVAHAADREEPRRQLLGVYEAEIDGVDGGDVLVSIESGAGTILPARIPRRQFRSIGTRDGVRFCIYVWAVRGSYGVELGAWRPRGVTALDIEESMGAVRRVWDGGNVQ